MNGNGRRLNRRSASPYHWNARATGTLRFARARSDGSDSGDTGAGRRRGAYAGSPR
jgi:hypothetical protein